jgi:CheY-like chemotaxis protein
MKDLGTIFWKRLPNSRFGGVSDAEGQFVRNRAIVVAIGAGLAARAAFDFDQHVGSIAPWIAMPAAYFATVAWGRMYYRGVGVNLPGRVLLVEDDRPTSGLMRRNFETRGWTVDQAFTVGEAIGLLAYEPRWVILDVTMPDGSGLNVASVMRANRSPAKLIVLTGTTDQAAHAEILAARPDSIVYKPVDDPTAILNTLGDPFE